MDWASTFSGLEEKYGLPPGYLARTAQIESSNNPNAQNPNSSAGGLFQFLDSTWGDYGNGASKFDPVASSDAAARLARDNGAQLRRALGRDPSGGELYLAHQQGGGGATKLLTNGNGSAAGTVGGAAVNLNGGNGQQSNSQFANQWINKFNNVPTPQGGIQMAGGPPPQLPALGAPGTGTPAMGAATPPVDPSKQPFDIANTPIGQMMSGKFDFSKMGEGMTKGGMGDALSLIAGGMGKQQAAPVPMMPPPPAHTPQVDPTFLARIAMGR